MPRGIKGTQETELTDKQLEDMPRLLKMGMTVTDVCLVVGISKDTFYKWAKRGKERPTGHPLRIFADAIVSGKSSAKAYALGQVHAGMKKDWKAAAWLLGVTHPKEYGPKVKVTLETEFSEALERLKAVLPEDMYEKALDAIVGRDGESGAGEDPPSSIDPLSS